MKPDRLRIIIDTVVQNFPVYQISKTDTELILRIQKTPEQIQEALSKSKLFSAIQKGDRESQLKMGSEDEGGLLFEGSQSNTSSASMNTSSPSTPSNLRESTAGTVSADGSKRVVFMLQDNKPYKIFLEESQTPVHIERIRPGYEVKGVQARLRQLGYNAGLVDGDVGAQTKEALKQFQKDKGLPVTGTPNKKTQRELRKEFGY
ncbi:MAG: peptidoglycan-binding protein [Deltaproteobacteria bacterium]|nr:peptidoglycan-binding protein [Deltaproteobacteria bacterium]